MKHSVNESLQLLGRTVTDRVTGIQGVVSSVAFDLNGCIKALVRPSANEGKLDDAYWLDLNRLKISKKARVMDLPDFVEAVRS